MTLTLIAWPFVVPAAFLTLLHPLPLDDLEIAGRTAGAPVSAVPSLRASAPLQRVVPRAASAAWPLSPRPEVVAGFDPPDQVWSAGHRGVDLLGTPGAAVHTALAGTVRFAGTIAGRGVLVVDHGGRRTTYEPVRSSVPVGADVAAGDQIGTLQAGPSHCAPRSCLHWGLIAGDRYLDPLTLVGAGPIRLLPLLTPVGARAGMPSGAARW